MWDTRSIIVRFRRQRGNTCLPGEPKNNSKKNKEEVVTNEQGQKEQNDNSTDSTKGRPISRSSTVSEENEKDSGKDAQDILQSPTTIEKQTKNLQPIAKNIRVWIRFIYLSSRIFFSYAIDLRFATQRYLRPLIERPLNSKFGNSELVVSLVYKNLCTRQFAEFLSIAISNEFMKWVRSKINGPFICRICAIKDNDIVY